MEYGLIFAWIDQSPDTQITSEKTYSYAKNNSQHNVYVAKTNYEHPLEFDAEIISQRVLTEREVREVYRKFFNKNKFCKLQFINNSVSKEYLNCILTNPERIEGGTGSSFGVVGFKVRIACDAPWGWSDNIEIKYTFKEQSNKNYNNDAICVCYSNDENKEAEFSLFNGSDCHEYIYPEVVINTLDEQSAEHNNSINIFDYHYCAACYHKNACKIGNMPHRAVIINTSDSENRNTCIFWSNETSGTGESMSIKMDARAGLIRENGASNINRISNSSKNFVRLVPGENKFKIKNISEITFKFKEAKVLV